MEPRKPNVLIIDIETTPMILAGWGLWDQNFGVNQIISPSSIMCFAYKWLEDKKVTFHSIWDDGPEAQANILYDLLDEAHVVAGYNSKKFDVRHINREIMETAKRPNPSPFDQIDLLTQWKRRFATPSNKLEYATQATGYETKLHHDGMPMWLDCMGMNRFGSPAVTEAQINKARKQMRLYNMQDVKVTEALFLFLRDNGWLINTPNMAAWSEQELACKVCGEDDPDLLRKKASKPTKAGVWRYNYHCLSCNSHFTGAVDKEAKEPHLKIAG